MNVVADVLVVYFSRSGITALLARRLAEKLGADLDTVRPVKPYAGWVGFIGGVWQSLSRRAPAVECEYTPSSYALVIIGSPVWAGRLSAPMRSYLTRFGKEVDTCAAFWVSGGGADYIGLSDEIQQLTGRAPIATASFTEFEVVMGATAMKLGTMVRAIRNRRGAASVEGRGRAS